MKHKITITVSIDANNYGVRGTQANAVNVAERCLRGFADWPPNAHIRIASGKVIRVRKTKGARFV